MFGILLMIGIVIVIGYIIVAKLFPSGMIHFYGEGDRKGRAEYQRIKREQPDSADANISEAEYVEKFVARTPKPWKYMLYIVLLTLIGIPMACVAGMASVMR